MNAEVSRRAMLYSSLCALAARVAHALPAVRTGGDEPAVIIPPYNRLTDTQEIQLGRRFAAQIDSSKQFIDQPAANAYLAGLVAQLAGASLRPGLPYTVKLINSDEVNAFSIAGGFLYVHRGLIDFIEQEDELVATLAHEIGHIVGRHCVNQLLQNFAARRLLDTVLTNLPKTNGVVERVIRQLGGAVAMLALLHFSREDELQADLYGFYEMSRAGWSPEGFLRLFARLQRMEAEEVPQLTQYVSSHPPSAARAEAIRKELAQTDLPAALRHDSPAFRSFKLSLKTAPRARHDAN